MTEDERPRPPPTTEEADAYYAAVETGILAGYGEADEAAELASADRLLDVVRALLEEARATIADAKVAKDPRLKLAALREARETSKLLPEVAGKFQNNAPVVEINYETKLTDARTFGRRLAAAQAGGPRHPYG